MKRAVRQVRKIGRDKSILLFAEEENEKTHPSVPSRYKALLISIEGETLHFRWAAYVGNYRLRVDLLDRYGGVFSTLTTNILEADLEPGEILVKTWGNNRTTVAACLASGIFLDTGKRYDNGLVTAQVWKFV